MLNDVEFFGFGRICHDLPRILLKLQFCANYEQTTKSIAEGVSWNCGTWEISQVDSAMLTVPTRSLGKQNRFLHVYAVLSRLLSCFAWLLFLTVVLKWGQSSVVASHRLPHILKCRWSAADLVGHKLRDLFWPSLCQLIACLPQQLDQDDVLRHQTAN